MTQKIIITFAENSPPKSIKQLLPIEHHRNVTYLWHQRENDIQCSGRGCLRKLEDVHELAVLATL